MRNRKMLAVPLLALILMGAACEDDKFRRASLAVNDFTIGLQAFQEAEIAAHNQGYVDHPTHRVIQEAVAKAAQASLVMTQAIRNTRNSPGAIGGIKAALDATQSLLDTGLAGVKNPQTKSQLQALVLGIRSPLLLLSGMFGGVQ